MVSTPSQHFEVIVLGGGTMGSAAALALGRRGVRTLVLEQFTTPNNLSSHSGNTRIIRHAYAESPAYVPLVRRADEMWQEIGAATGQTLLHRTGGLDISAPGFTQAQDARKSAEEWGVPFEWLTGAEVNARWPAFSIPDDWEVCFSPVTGYLDVDPALLAMKRLATEAGVEWHEHEPARQISADPSGVVVDTDQARYTADRLIVTAGAWTGHVLAGIGLPLTPLRKVLWWIEVEDRPAFSVGQFPVFICSTPGADLYAIPMTAEDPGLKIADHAGGEPTDPDAIVREVRDEEASHVITAARQLLKGITGTIQHREVCMYTMTPDEDFIVDRHPAHDHVVIACGFSGHGFKFAPAIGEHLADLALNPMAEPYPHMAMARLQTLPS